MDIRLRILLISLIYNSIFCMNNNLPHGSDSSELSVNEESESLAENSRYNLVRPIATINLSGLFLFENSLDNNFDNQTNDLKRSLVDRAKLSIWKKLASKKVDN